MPILGQLPKLTVLYSKEHFRFNPGFPQKLNSLRTDGDFCHRGRDTEIAKNFFSLSEPTDMTIHWKALEEQFFDSSVFRGEIHFLNFSQTALNHRLLIVFSSFLGVLGLHSFKTMEPLTGQFYFIRPSTMAIVIYIKEF
jgi:hypothetical protein